jgi:HEAT repeat protein
MMTDIQQLIQQLVEPATRQQGYTALVALGAAAVDPLVAAFERTTTEYGQQQIALVLSAIGDARSLPALLEWARSGLPKARQSAVVALGAFGADPRVPEALRDIARRDPDFTVRLSAVNAIGRAVNKEAEKALWLEFLNDSSEQAVSTAVMNLPNRFPRDPQVADALLAALQRPDLPQSAVGWLMNGLSAMGEARAFEAIAARLQAPDARQRAHAANALGKLGDLRAVDLLKALQGDRAFAWEEDHGGPKYSVGDVAKQALATLLKQPATDHRGAPPSSEKKPWWKVW